ncbi:MAG: hypothetical protein SVR08_05110 [Spirochaetota bacterium]|nr:hypothetical protein [Spirochaetota bacterium]
MKKLKWKIFLISIFCSIFFHIIPVMGVDPGENSEGSGNSESNTRLEEGGVSFSGADEGEYINLADSDEGIIILTGNIKMEFDNKVIYAKRVLYNRKTGDITLTEDVVFHDSENRIETQKCVYNLKDRAGVLYNVKSVNEPIFFDAKKVKIVSSKTYITQNIKPTSCSLERPHYHFRIRKLWLYSDNRVVGYNAIYIVGDVPLFYFPIIVHSQEGFGIITQFGITDRRGKFLQNTLRYTTENGDRWKYKLDIYEKLGQYGGVEYKRNRDNLNIDLYLAGAKYKNRYNYLSEDMEEDENIDFDDTSYLPNENWFKTVLKSNYYFNIRGGSRSYSNIDFEWMNDRYFEYRFDNRNEPETTFEMLYWTPNINLARRDTLNWYYSIGDTGDRYNISLSFFRQWKWYTTADRDALKGKYLEQYDKLPYFSFSYNGSFFILGDKSDKSKGQLINWNTYLYSESYKEYREGDYYSLINKYNGYFNIRTVVPFFRYLTYTPSIKNGFYAEWLRGGPFDNNNDYRRDRKDTADKSTFLYVEPSNKIRFGITEYYFEAAHYYRRSFCEKKVVEPFVHEKLNYIIGGIYLFPAQGIDMSITTKYDLREKFPFEDERLSDIVVTNNFFFDFYRYLNGKSTDSGKRRGLFFSGINISNMYKYITKDNRSGYDTLDLSFNSGNFSIPGIRLIRNANIGATYFHDFRYQYRDMMSINWNIEADIARYWKVNIGGSSQADKVNEFYDKELGNTLYDDLEKTYYFYDKDKSNNSVFTLRNFHLNIIHDLHCWELGVFFVINRLIEDTGPDNMDRVIYYDKSIYLTLRIKSFPGIGLSGMEVSPDKGVREY